MPCAPVVSTGGKRLLPSTAHTGLHHTAHLLVLLPPGPVVAGGCQPHIAAPAAG
jgi:hypothetical protein